MRKYGTGTSTPPTARVPLSNRCRVIAVMTRSRGARRRSPA
jgi:hypothetical protein